MKNLVEFIRRYAAVFLFFLLEIISISLIISSTSYKQWKGGKVVREVTGPVLKQRAKASSYLHLRRENRNLMELERELFRQAYNTDIGNRTVTEIYMDSLKQPLFEYTAAQVLENTTFLPDNYLILDKGAKDGVHSGMGILSDKGVVGIVKDVSPHFCTVMSLLHSRFSLSVILKDGVVTGVLYWDGKSHRKALIRNVSTLGQIKIGDTLVTHHSLIFPSHYPVGTVSKIHTEVEDGFYSLEIRLSNAFDRMNTVWIVRNNYQEEIQTLRDSTFRHE